MSDPLLHAAGLAVGYPRRTVLSDLGFQLARGTFAALLGANGSGKTTLMKTILGILPALSGHLRWAAPAPRLGYVPQHESLDPGFLLSCQEVVQLGMCGRIGPARFFRRADQEFARECLRRTGMAPAARERFAELSGGQKQRVILARALAAQPEFLLLDEPTSGVDPAATQGMLDLLRDLHAAQGMTVLMVSHDLPAVKACAHEVLWLHQGRLMQGSVAEMLDRGRMAELLALELQ